MVRYSDRGTGSTAVVVPFWGKKFLGNSLLFLGVVAINSRKFLVFSYLDGKLEQSLLIACLSASFRKFWAEFDDFGLNF